LFGIATRRKYHDQRGVSLMEALVGMVLLAIIGLAITGSTIFFIKMRHKAMADALATQLALEKLEEFAAIDPANYSSGQSWSETVSRSGRNFTRESRVTVNSDDSRTFVVNISAEKITIGGEISMSNTYTPWAMQ